MTIAPTGKPRVIRGPAYVLGDNIDTDQIIPAEYLNLVPTIPEEYTRLGGHALAGLPAGLPPFVDALTGKSPYPIVIAGANFGCGSSREHAPVALGAAGCVPSSPEATPVFSSATRWPRANSIRSSRRKAWGSASRRARGSNSIWTPTG